MTTDNLDVAIIGAGFAGLATAAELKRRGVARFAVLEQGNDVGNFWRTNTYDCIRLHSAWHDLPNDGGAIEQYPMFKTRADLLRYFEDYARHHELPIRFGERVSRIKQMGAGAGKDHDWLITTQHGELGARYLVIATGVNRAPSYPVLYGHDEFVGTIIHSSQYRNPAGFVGRRVLVVGSGNSGAEIAIDLLRGGASHTALWVRGPRYFIPLPRMKWLFHLFRLLKLNSPESMDARHRIRVGTPEFDAALEQPDRVLGALATDLGRWGIRKPDAGPAREQYANGRIPTFDVGAIPAIRSGKLQVIDGNVREIEAVGEGGVRFSDGIEPFDAVILGTGFKPRLEDFLDDADKMTGPVRWHARSALTDGRCRSTVFPSAFFPGFDPTVLGGLSLGRWGVEVGDRIADEL
jgi:cation diffusion facilitator CzcD-associated flavoprotein CzcO